METPANTQRENMTVTAAGNADHTAGLSEDRLGFRPYVEAVYSYLKNDQTKAPFTMSIEGDWGSGKSSFMYQLEQSLNANKLVDKIATVRFNAWRHDKVETMWAAFALHFINDLLNKMNFIERIFVNLELRWKRFDLEKGWFSVLKTVALFGFYVYLSSLFLAHYHEFSTDFIKNNELEWNTILPIFGSAGIILGLLFFLKGLSNIAGNPFKLDLQKFVNKPKYEGNVAFIEKFHRDFEQTVNILTRKYKKVFVFIDDLDRADIPKAAELMQGLNMMISVSPKLIVSNKSKEITPKLIFILGIDREKVAAGIAAKYKDLLPFLNPKQQPLDTEWGLGQAQMFGYNFLEKFIQLSFQLPKGSTHFTDQLIDSLSNVTAKEQNNKPVLYNPVLVITDGEDSLQFREVTKLLAPFFEFNPRRIKQFVNIFRLKAHIANSTGLFNNDTNNIPPLTIPQLGKFIAISILIPQFVDDLLQDFGLIKKLLTFEHSNPWKNDKQLMNLLELKPNKDKTGNSIYNMAEVNIESLMETSPLVESPQRPTTTTTTQAPTESQAYNNEQRTSNSKRNRRNSSNAETFSV